MDRDDSELIQTYLATGEEEAFIELVHRYIGVVYNVVSRLVGSTDADDVTQDAFIKAWKHLEKFKPGERFLPWLLTIARNSAIDRLRKQRALTFSTLDTEIETFEETIPDDAPLPDALLANRDLAGRLDDALDSLAPQYREVVVLHDMEDLTFEEIAVILKKPMNTVKSQYRRAVLLLRQSLSEDAPK